MALRKQGLVGTACLLLLLAAPAPSAERDPEKQLQDVRERIEELQRSIRRDTDRRDSLSAQLRDAEEKVRGARGRLGSVRKRSWPPATPVCPRLTTDRERTERDSNEQREALASQLRTAYMGGREEHLKLLLSQEDPAAFGRMLTYYSYLGRARAGKIAEIEAAATALEQAVQQEEEERRAPRRTRGG